MSKAVANLLDRPFHRAVFVGRRGDFDGPEDALVYVVGGTSPAAFSPWRDLDPETWIVAYEIVGLDSLSSRAMDLMDALLCGNAFEAVRRTNTGFEKVFITGLIIEGGAPVILFVYCGTMTRMRSGVGEFFVRSV